MKARAFLSRTAAIVAGKGIQDGLKFGLLLWLAREDQAGFGILVFGVGVAVLTRSVLGLGLDQFTLRELTLRPTTRGRVLGQMVRLKVVLGLVVLGIVHSFGRLRGWTETEIVVVLVLCAGQVLEGVADSFFSLYRAEGRQVQEAACSSTAHVLGAAYGAAVLLWGWGVVAVSFFVVISNGFKVLLAVGFGARTGMMPKLGRGVSILPKGQGVSLGTVVVFNFLGSFYNQVQVFLLKQFKGLGDLALYGAAGELGGGLVSLVSGFVTGAVLYPSLARAALGGPEDLAAVVRLYFWRMAAFGLGTAFLFYTLGGELILIVFGTAYAGSVAPLQVLGLAILFSLVNNLLIHALLASRQERLLLRLHLAPALVSLPLGCILIPRLGPVGAALNLLVCRIIMTVLIVPGTQARFGLLAGAPARPFLMGGIILGMTYLALRELDVPLPQLPALAGYGWWTWRWTLGAARAPMPARNGKG